MRSLMKLLALLLTLSMLSASWSVAAAPTSDGSDRHDSQRRASEAPDKVETTFPRAPQVTLEGVDRYPKAAGIDIWRVLATQHSDSHFTRPWFGLVDYVYVGLYATGVKKDTKKSKQIFCVALTNRAGEAVQRFCHRGKLNFYGGPDVRDSNNVPVTACPRSGRSFRAFASAPHGGVSFYIPIDCFGGGSDWAVTAYSYWAGSKDPAKWVTDNLDYQYLPYFRYVHDPDAPAGNPNEPPGDVDCDDFTHWLEADQALTQSKIEYGNDRYALDADGDGYPCESLAASSPVNYPYGFKHPTTGEWLSEPSHDGGAPRFRSAFWLTWKDIGQPQAVQTALLDGVWGQVNPGSSAQQAPAVRQRVETIYDFISVDGGSAPCYRGYLLAYLWEQAEAEHYVDAAHRVFGLADVVFELVNPDNGQKHFLREAPDWPAFGQEYLKVGADFMDAMQDVKFADQVHLLASDSLLCDPAIN